MTRLSLVLGRVGRKRAMVMDAEAYRNAAVPGG